LDDESFIGPMTLLHMQLYWTLWVYGTFFQWFSLSRQNRKYHWFFSL